MRIISKYKDYYDHAISYGIDSTLVFERRLNFFEKHPFEKVLIEQYSDSQGIRVELQQFIVVVAGKIYRGKYLYGDDMFFYSYDEQKEYFNQQGIREYYWSNTEKEFFNKPSISEVQLNWIKDNRVIIGSTCCSLSNYDNGDNLYSKGGTFGNNFVSNHSSLKNLKFQQVIDGLDLFNEISMWVSNLDQKELVTLNNEEKLIKAGFDKKISFRNPIK